MTPVVVDGRARSSRRSTSSRRRDKRALLGDLLARRARSTARWCSRGPSTAPTGSPSISQAPASSADGDPRQQVAERARARARRLQERRDSRPGRDRYRRARHRHQGSLARHQLRLPEVPESYVHRIGRTARAGRRRRAVVLHADERGDFTRSNACRASASFPWSCRASSLAERRRGNRQVRTGQPQPRLSPERIRDSVRDSAPAEMQARPVERERERAPRPGYAAPRRRRAFA